MMAPILFRDVDRLVNLHIIPLMPALDIVFIHAQTGVAGTVNHNQLIKIRTVLRVMDVFG